MDRLDRVHIAQTVAVMVIQSMKLNKETKHIRIATPAHREVWIQSLEEVIEQLQKDLANVKKNHEKEDKDG